MREKNKVVKGSLWTGVASAVTMISQLARVMILTRFLERSDFGVVAIINMVIGLCYAFGDLGFSSVIMYKRNMSDKEFSSLYWLQLFLYIAIYVVICLCSPLFSFFYEEESLIYLIPLSALSIITLSVGKLYESVLQKEYEFKSISFRNIISNVSSLFLALLLAIEGFGIYSLIISTLFQNLLYNVLSLLVGYSHRNLKFFFSFKEAKPLLNIGIYQTYTRIADYLSSQLDVLIIGKFLGTDILGGYDLAKQLVNRFVNFFKTTISQVALPVLTSKNDDDEAVKGRFLLITRIVAFICIPVSFIIAVFSKELMVILYGSIYADIAIIASIFALITMLSSITCFFDMLGIAKGRTDLNFKNTVYRVLITTPIVLLTSLISIEAVALGQLVAMILQIIIFWRIVVLKTYPMSFNRYFSTFSNYMFVWLFMSLLLWILKERLSIFEFITNEYLQLFSYVFLGLLFMVVAYASILKKDIVFVYTILKR